MRNNPNTPTLRAKLAAFLSVLALALGIAAVGPAKTVSAYSPSPSWTTCSQTAYFPGTTTATGRRVCFDKSQSRIYIYTSDTASAGPSSSYPATQTFTAGYSVTPFISTGAEFFRDPQSPYTYAAVNPSGGNNGLGIFIQQSGPSTNTIIVPNATGISTIISLSNQAAYEFAWVA